MNSLLPVTGTEGGAGGLATGGNMKVWLVSYPTSHNSTLSGSSEQSEMPAMYFRDWLPYSASEKSAQEAVNLSA